MKAERIVALYMQALGDTELPEAVWKRLADVNGVILREKHLAPHGETPPLFGLQTSS